MQYVSCTCELMKGNNFCKHQCLIIFHNTNVIKLHLTYIVYFIMDFKGVGLVVMARFNLIGKCHYANA